MHPKPLFNHLSEIENELKSKKLSLYLDYDGTLTPIVPDPRQAVLTDETKNLLENLSSICSLAIISGRDRSNVESLVPLKRVHFAGSHGFDIKLSDGTIKELEEAGSARKELQEISALFDQRLRHVPNILVEEKRYAVAVHYRKVQEEHIPEIDRVINETLKEFHHLKRTGGKKIFEIRLEIKWNKGQALLWMREHLNEANTVPIYIGDDLTDEDGFEAIKDIGLGILVGSPDSLTQAKYFVETPDDVLKFLFHLFYIKDLKLND